MIPMTRIPNPPTELVEIVAKDFAEAWDRGWYKLIGHSPEFKVFEHRCKDQVFSLALPDYKTSKDTYKVAKCYKCQCFYYLGPV